MNISYTVVVVGFLLNACTSAPPETISVNPIAKRLIGKTRTELLECAGAPAKEVPYGHGAIFRYYKEAPMLDESRPFLKGSMAYEHHGCWANLLLEKDEVTGVEFRPTPDTAGHEHCEEIFATCLQGTLSL